MKHLIILSLILRVVFTYNMKHEVYCFKQLKFAWPSAEAQNAALQSERYIPNNNVILGATRWKDKLFLTLPRWKPGVAATLGYISLSAPHEKSPKIIPYPDWPSNTLPSIGSNNLLESQLYSVTKCRVDDFNRLWCLDTGIQGIYRDHRIKLAKPALVIFDLKTNSLVRRYTFKNTDFYDISTPIYLVLDSRSPDDVDAYVSDMDAMGLVCYSFYLNDSRRIVHSYMYPDPMFGPYTLDNINFAMPIGLYGLFLSHERKYGYRKLYFHCGASTKLFQVSTEVLRNATYANGIEAYNKFQLVGDGGSNSVLNADAMDYETGILLTAQLLKNTISCWNTALPFNSHNLKPVLRDGGLINAVDATLDDEGYLWITSSRTIRFLQNCLSCDDNNYRILKISVKEAIKPCLLSG